MPCFAANTKLGIVMIDGIGGSGKVNNLLATLNIKPIPKRNLQKMERRAGQLVEAVAEFSMKTAAQAAFQQEMSDIASEETKQAASQMPGLIEDLGVCSMPDASPNTRKIFDSKVVVESPVGDALQPQYSKAKHIQRPGKVISSKTAKYAVIIDNKCLIKKSFIPSDMQLTIQGNKEKKHNLPSLTSLIYNGVMKLCTAENIASSGLNLSHLKTLYKRHGEDGLYNVFQMKNNLGQPRVTNDMLKRPWSR